ncbi:hypothetical protein ACFL3V_05045 [Nanoarchaeota archaeon]
MCYEFLLAGLVASIVWFIVGGALYMNPAAVKIHKKEAKSPAMSKMKHGRKWMVMMYLFGCFVPSLIFAAIYVVMKPVLPGTVALNTMYFGMMIVGMKLIPRLADMALLTSYPQKLLALDFTNGTISAFVVALVLSLML